MPNLTGRAPHRVTTAVEELPPMICVVEVSEICCKCVCEMCCRGV